MRPLVAIAGRHLTPDQVPHWHWTSGVVALPRAYPDALVRAGANPVVLPPASPDGALDGIAALVLAGGGDIEPAQYGADAHPTVYGIDPALDDFELAIARDALDRGIPVLAICRGHQVLNVLLGGTLEQHLPDRGEDVLHGSPVGGSGGSDHEVTIAAGTRLAAAVGCERALIRSFHHQAVADLGKGLTATAWADDGTIEAMELEGDPWVVSVQWHPEMTAATDPIQQRIFDTFVAQA